MKFKVRSVPAHVLGGYEGMNYYAGKKFGFKPLPGKSTVLVDRGYSKGKRETVVKHEITEAKLMSRGYSYWSAHKRALKEQRK